MTLTVPGFTVLERIGVGARSTIWQVCDHKTGEMYALKRVVRRVTDDNRYLEQAQNEFRVSVRFEHENLRRSYEIRRIRKLFQLRELHILMEYLPGKTLEQETPAHIEDIIRVFTKVAEGLAAMHQGGYVHADIKPNNILIGSDNLVKIIDFGQSCPMGFVKPRVQGTPDYIAPEQVRRLPLDQRTDVFNLGATLYQVVTGKTFPTMLPASRGRAGIDLATPKSAVPPHEANPDVPLALSRLVMDCCQTRSKDRPSNMREVIGRLEVTCHLLERGEGMGGGVPSPRDEEDEADDDDGRAVIPDTPSDSAA